MKITTTVQFLLVRIACSGHAVTWSSTSGNETDLLSLLDFKKAILVDPQKALISWNESTNYCQWEGILCTAKAPFRVISLDLANLGFLGQISPSLGNLTYLRNMSLSSNRFEGKIPATLGHLHHLQTLYLSNNTLQGIIPDFANCSNLKVLWLDGNNLVGQFPGLPPQLQELRLALNYLTGTIPSSLPNITTLLRFICAFNNIRGNIPNEFANFPSLQTLLVSSNQLSGKFPQAILNVTTLIAVGLSGNHLSREVPSDLGSTLRNLQALALDGNYFQGHIPSSLNNASNLFDVSISANNFTGVIPSSIGKLTKLSVLNLELNRLHAYSKQDWEFLNNLANCTELQVLSVAFNQLEGQVPSSLGNLSVQLQRLYLGNNQLAGGFPLSIVNLPNLIILGLESNKFNGVVPEWLGSLKNLQGLDLKGNMLTGSIPSSLSNLSHLVVLLMELNQFDGQIPPSFGDLHMLETLSISNNLLHGSIPKEIFEIPSIWQMDLSFNNLVGQVPPEVGNAAQLNYLNLSSNNLSGDIPSTLGNSESLEEIMLDWNFFSGSIPSTLGKIRSLKVLNLSHNNLTGSIPLSLGNLQVFEQLDLSFNHLTGEVPTKGIFENATAVQIDGNQGLCGGPFELHLLACSIMSMSSPNHKKSVALKVTIPMVSMVSLAVVMYGLLFFIRRKQNRASVPLPSFGSKFPKVSYSDLTSATEGFSISNLIGKGKYSSVYQGTLFEDRFVVAIKVFSLETKGAHKSFIAECNALRNLRHRNLVSILTACSSIDKNGNDFKALVYELMPRGDLHALLYMNRDDANSSTPIRITLAQRLNILVDVADALEYLHHNNQETIVHCDLKPSNILLDDNMTAHVGDFGLARFKFDSTASSLGDSISASSAAIRGTIGYVAPECAQGGEVSSAGDVYSFGIVLLEILLRKRPTDDTFNYGLDIVKFVQENFPDRMFRIVDPELLEEQHDFSQETSLSMNEKSLGCLISVINIGLDCTKASPNERMGMQEVAANLHGIKDAYLKGNIDPSGH